jgi:hypothetical protein
VSFRDLDEFLLDRPIELPIRGKTYQFPGSIPARSGLLLQRIAAAAEKAQTEIVEGRISTLDLAAEVLSNEEETDLRGEIMGATELEMAKDGLSTAHTTHVFRTLITWHMAGPEAAEVAWERQGEAQAPNRATRRASKASASSTRKRASTSGTTTRTPAKATARRGATSSSTGA